MDLFMWIVLHNGVWIIVICSEAAIVLIFCSWVYLPALVLMWKENIPRYLLLLQKLQVEQT